MINQLISAGADVNVLDYDNWNSLFYASDDGN